MVILTRGEILIEIVHGSYISAQRSHFTKYVEKVQEIIFQSRKYIRTRKKVVFIER